MNLFTSFEMVFDNGERFMGNKTITYKEIESEQDIKFIEGLILDSLNTGLVEGDLGVDIVTLTNWKTL